MNAGVPDAQQEMNCVAKFSVIEVHHDGSTLVARLWARDVELNDKLLFRQDVGMCRWIKSMG
jgi:hypothetical protein